MESQIGICRMALGHIHAQEIEDLAEDTVEAGACNDFWDTARRVCLALHSWTFASKLAELAQVDSSPLDGLVEYELPSDFVRAIDLVPVAGERITEFRRRGGSLFTKHDFTYLRYVYDLDEPEQWDPLFDEVVSWRLAAYIAMPLTEKSAMRNFALQGFGTALAEAKLTDGHGQLIEQPRRSRTMDARR